MPLSNENFIVNSTYLNHNPKNKIKILIKYKIFDEILIINYIAIYPLSI